MPIKMQAKTHSHACGLSQIKRLLFLDEASREEMERFLSSLDVKAERNPSMLGLLLAILAHGSLIDHFGVSADFKPRSHSLSQDHFQVGNIFSKIWARFINFANMDKWLLQCKHYDSVVSRIDQIPLASKHCCYSANTSSIREDF